MGVLGLHRIVSLGFGRLGIGSGLDFSELGGMLFLLGAG